MMRKIYIIGRRDERTHYDTPQSMVAGLTKVTKSARYHAAVLEDLLFVFDGSSLKVLTSEGNDLADADAIFMMGWFKDKMLEDTALAVSMYAQAHGIPLLNSEVSFARSNSKLSQCVAAAIQNVSIVPFVFSMSHARMQQGSQEVGLQYPLIIKSVRASRGRDNYLVHTKAELDDVLAHQPEVRFMVQHFVPNDGDYRIIIMGNEVRFVMHRLAQEGTHLSNTSQGGTATQIAPDNLPEAMREQALRISKTLRREVTGVDMIVDKTTGQHYMLEINNMPQLSTGSLVTEKMSALDAFLTNWAA